MDSLEPYSGQAVDKMVDNEMEDVRVERLCQRTRKTGLEAFYYKNLFYDEEEI